MTSASPRGGNQRLGPQQRRDPLSSPKDVAKNFNDKNSEMRAARDFSDKLKSTRLEGAKKARPF